MSLKICFQVQENTEVFTLSFLRVKDLSKNILRQNGIPFLSHALSSDGEIMSYDLVLNAFYHHAFKNVSTTLNVPIGSHSSLTLSCYFKI